MTGCYPTRLSKFHFVKLSPASPLNVNKLMCVANYTQFSAHFGRIPRDTHSDGLNGHRQAVSADEQTNSHQRGRKRALTFTDEKVLHLCTGHTFPINVLTATQDNANPALKCMIIKDELRSAFLMII